MMTNMIWGILGIVAGVVLCLILLNLRRSRTSVSERPPNRAPDPEIETLRQNLRLKVMYDEGKIDRLIEAEKQRTPSASEVDWYRNAIERWERDNR